jgi:hypothetical protein
MKPKIIITVVLGVASAGFLGWRVITVHNRATPQFSLLEDPSGSHLGGCASVVGITEQILHSERVSSGSSLTVLAIGDESTADEPRLVSRRVIPVSRRVMEGAHAGLRAQQEMVDDVQRRCEALHPTKVSPIFQGVKQAIGELRRLGCKSGSNCELWIDSDGEENVVSSIRRALEVPGHSDQALPSPVDNDGIHVAFCGLAVTAGRISDASGREIRRMPRRSPDHDDNLQRIWAGLFTKPELVTFAPYCPEPSSSRGGASR